MDNYTISDSDAYVSPVYNSSYSNINNDSKSINNIDSNTINEKDIKCINENEIETNNIEVESINSDEFVNVNSNISNCSSFLNLNESVLMDASISKTFNTSNLLINQLIDLNNKRSNETDELKNNLNNQIKPTKQYGDLKLDDNLNFLNNSYNIDAQFSPISSAKLEKYNLENTAITPIYKNTNVSRVSNTTFFSSEINELYTSNDNFSKVLIRRSASNARAPTPLFESKLKVIRARCAIFICKFNYFRGYSDLNNPNVVVNDPTSNLEFDVNESKSFSIFSSLIVFMLSIISYIYTTSFQKMINDSLKSIRSFYLTIFYGIYNRIVSVAYWLVSYIDAIIDYFLPCLFNLAPSSNVSSCVNSTLNSPRLTHASLAAITAPPCSLLLSPSQLSQYSTNSLMTINSADLSFFDDMDESITPALIEDRMRFKKFGSSRESSFCKLLKFLRGFIFSSTSTKKK